MIDPIDLVGIAGAPLVVALVQVIRTSDPELPTRYLPGLTLLVAIVLNLGLALIVGSSLPVAVLVGIVTGLTASGMYSQATAGLKAVALTPGPAQGAPRTPAAATPLPQAGEGPGVREPGAASGVPVEVPRG